MATKATAAKAVRAKRTKAAADLVVPKFTKQPRKSAQSVAQAAPTQQHRTTAFNLTHVANYPKKLVIYQLGASPFWWTRYYAEGRILRRSTDPR